MKSLKELMDEALIEFNIGKDVTSIDKFIKDDEKSAEFIRLVLHDPDYSLPDPQSDLYKFAKGRARHSVITFLTGLVFKEFGDLFSSLDQILLHGNTENAAEDISSKLWLITSLYHDRAYHSEYLKKGHLDYGKNFKYNLLTDEYSEEALSILNFFSKKYDGVLAHTYDQILQYDIYAREYHLERSRQDKTEIEMLDHGILGGMMVFNDLVRKYLKKPLYNIELLIIKTCCLTIACDDTPVFDALKNHATRGSNENKEVSLSDPKAKKDWMETAGIFLDTLKGTLILTDNNGQQWVCLTKYCDTGHKDLNTKQFLAWSWVYAYFMTPEQANDFTKCAEKGLSVITNDTASHHQTYAVFNREYPWSPSCREFEEHAWVEARIKTGDIETITETIHIPNLKPIETHLQKYWGFTDDDEELAENVELLNGKDVAKDDVADFDTSEICFKEETRYRQVEAEKEIGKILHATTDLVWEEEYDATKEEAISYHVPCAKLIEDMNLSQIVADGFFYDSEGKLAAFDTNLTQKINSVVVRKDILDGFLAKNGMKLVWLVKAEKEIHAKDYLIADWSEWEAVFSYEDDRVEGKIRKIPKRTG